MLPGGMNVLGIFIVGPADCLADSNCVRKFKMILSAIQKNLKANKYLYGTNEQENLILNFNSTNERFVSFYRIFLTQILFVIVIILIIIVFCFAVLFVNP